MNYLEIDRSDLVNFSTVNLALSGTPALPATRRRISFFQPVKVSLEYRYESREWNLTRVEASGPVCQEDGGYMTDGTRETYIYAWLPPLLPTPTLSNPDGVPDWILALGEEFKPQ